MTKDNIPRYGIEGDNELRLSIINERCAGKTIPVHRHTYYEIIIITHSNDESLQTHDIDFISYPLKAGYIYFLYPSQVHKWNFTKYERQFDGYIINFYERFLLEKNNNIKNLLLKLFNPFETNNKILFNQNKFIEHFPVIKPFVNEYNKPQKNINILKSLLETLLYYMEDLKINSNDKIDTSFIRLVELKNLIEDNYKEIKNSEFYAKKMDLSVKRLNEIVKKVSGMTITEMIHNRLMLEAKRALAINNKTIQDVSYELGFENPSYFAKFFKKNEGISPKEYSFKMLK